MAKVTIRVDDFDSTVLDDEIPPVKFSLDEEYYSIDLNPENTAALRQALAPYIQRARKENQPSKKTVGGPSLSRASRYKSPTRLDKNHPLADCKGYVILAKETICNAIGDKKLTCFWCDKVIVSKASKAKSNTFVVSFLDRNPKHIDVMNIEPAHSTCHRGWLLARNSALSEAYAQKVADRLENGPLWE